MFSVGCHPFNSLSKDNSEIDYQLPFQALTCSPSLPPSLPQYITLLRGNSEKSLLTIGDAVNLAILEEMVRDPTTTIHAEDLQVREGGREGRKEGGREGCGYVLMMR